MNALVRYDAACAALDAAISADEVMHVRLELKAIEAVARVAGNVDFEMKAISLRTRAETRLGEMLEQGEAAGILNSHGGRRKKKGQDSDGDLEKPTLKDIGIKSNKLAAHCRNLSGIGAKAVGVMLERFERETQRRGRIALNVIHEATAKRSANSRRQLARELSECSALSATGRKFAALYADPAWRRKAGIGNRAYENQYPTMAWEELLAMPVKDRLLPDAQGYIWIPRAHLLALIEIDYPTSLGIAKLKMPLAWAIAYAWGFDSYSTCAVWTKTDEENPDDHGLGLVFWDQDELLLVFKRGRGLPKPDTDKKYGSNHRERADKHSAKPKFYRTMINDMTGGVPVLELFAREDDEHPLPENFFTWGNESNNTAEAPAPIDANGDALAHDDVGEIIDTPNRENALTQASPEALPELNHPNCLDVEVPHDEMLEVPAFLLRRPDNSIPSESVSVASPRATQLADAERSG